MSIEDFIKLFDEKYEKNIKRMKIIEKLFGITE